MHSLLPRRARVTDLAARPCAAREQDHPPAAADQRRWSRSFARAGRTSL